MAKYERDDSGQWWYYFGVGETRRTRATAIKCEWCGQDCFQHVMQQNPVRFCSKKCSGKWQHYETEHPFGRSGSKSVHWKGGRRISRGYVHIYAPGHPRNVGKTKHGANRYVREHRLIMEEALGRYLKPSEVVHHINGDRLDNRIENLELWINGHPYGQRAGDIKHCPTCTCRQPDKNDP